MDSGSVRPVMDVLRRYGTAVAAVAITVAVKLAIDGLGQDHPFVLLPVPVAVAAWYGGRGPGFVAATLIAIVGSAFLTVTVFDGGDLIALVVVTIEAFLIVLITAGLKDALVRAERSRIAADDARRELKFAVAVRDEVLRLWTEKVRGPLGRLEVRATEAVSSLEREGYRGSAVQALRSIVEDAGLLRRVTAGWRDPQFPARTDET